MKKLAKCFALILLTVSIISCSSDDGDSIGDIIQGESYFTYQDEDYPIKAGLIFDNDDGRFDFSFVTSEIQSSLGEVTTESEQFENLTFEIISDSTETKPEADEYIFTSEPEEMGLHAADLVFVESEEEYEEFAATDGSITIDYSGSLYKIEFDITLDNGETVTGKYRGSLLTESDMDELQGNFIDYNDEIEELHHAYMNSREANAEDLYAYDIALSPNDIVDENDSLNFDDNESYTLLSVTLYSEEDELPEEGYFDLAEEGNNELTPQILVWNKTPTNGDFEEEDIEDIDAESGWYEVKEVDDGYRIDAEYTLTNGEIIRAFYRGELKDIELEN